LAGAVLFSLGEHVFLSSYWLAQFYLVEESMYSFLPIGWRMYSCLLYWLAHFYSVDESMYSFLPIGFVQFC
jgi:hypothetical protein